MKAFWAWSLFSAKLATSAGPWRRTFSPSSVTYSLTGSMGRSFSLVRKRPTASKDSRLNPSGLITEWQDWQAWGLVIWDTFWRIVRLGEKSPSLKFIAIGGGRRLRPT